MVIAKVLRRGKGNAEGSLDTAASEQILQVSAKHQQRESSARGKLSNPRQEAGEAGGMTTGSNTAAVESEESFSSEVGVGQVGMSATDNFCPTTVSGDLNVDVGDFENGSVCSVLQSRKLGDDFQPREILDFVNRMALSSTNAEHEDFVKNKATALAYRKGLYEKFNKTHAQAFGHEPERPSRKQQDVTKPPKTATPAPMTTGIKTAGAECEESFRSEVGVGQVGMSATDNFRPATVSGDLNVVGDFENGSVCSVLQSRKLRDDFQPREILDFVNRMALSSTNVEHEDFVKNKATSLAYRKALSEKFNKTYAQTFGHEPERPSRKQQDVKKPPKTATPAPMNTGIKTAGVECEESFRSEVGVGQVGMSATDNFHPTTVSGDLNVVGDFENGSFCSVLQSRKLRDDFQPREILDFVNRMALSSTNAEHEDFVRNKATALAYRNFVYEKSNKTHAQAFGHEPERPSRKQQDVKKPPKTATPAPMNTGIKTAGVECEESFRSEVGVGQVGMSATDNFHPTTVSGDLNVDVGDFENGSVCSVLQSRKLRDDFQPREILDFVNRMALSSTNSEHEDFVRNKATALAYRNFVYEKFNKTHAQAFGHEPERPSRKQQDVKKPPKTATPAPMNTGIKTAGVECEESFRSEVGVGQVGMSATDNFHPTTVSGDLNVDVGNFENGSVCSVLQSRKLRDDFHPREILDFVNRMALSSTNAEHEDFVRNKTTALAYRNFVYEKLNETHAQAFGHEPERPSCEEHDMNQPPKTGTPASLHTRAWIIISSPESSELLSDPQFVEDHLNNLDEFRDCLVLYAPDTGDTIRSFALNGLMEIGALDIPEIFCNMLCDFVADVDGLVCLLFNDDPVILNPILQEWTFPSKIPELALADTVCYAFGKDRDGDYKILRFSENPQSRKKKEREIAVFSSSASSWSLSSQRFPNNIRDMCHGICVGGVAYIVCTPTSESEKDHEKSVISAVNLSDLSGTQLDVPGICSEVQHWFFYLFSLHDKLGLVQIVSERGQSWKRIWRLQQPGDASSWEMMFEIPFDDRGRPKRYLPVRNELVLVENDVDGSLLVYLLDTNNVCKLEKRLKLDLNGPEEVCTCLASLVSLS